MIPKSVDDGKERKKKKNEKNGKSTLMMVMIIRLKIRFSFERGKRIEFDLGNRYTFCRMGLQTLCKSFYHFSCTHYIECGNRIGWKRKFIVRKGVIDSATLSNII